MNHKLDIGGILIALGCMIHCIALPFLLSSLTFFSFELIDNIYLDLALVCLSFYVGLRTLIPNYRLHHRKLPLVLFVSGLLLLLCKEVVHQSLAGLLLTALALGLLIVAHTLNIAFVLRLSGKACRREP